MSTAVATIPNDSATLATSDFMPVFDLTTAITRRNMLVKFVQELMTKDIDFGSPGGMSGKPSLLKAGAEKLVTFFGLTPEFITVEQVEDWTGSAHNGEAFFYYRYKCRLTKHGRPIGEGEGSCNTWESKYRYRWVSESYAVMNGFPLDSLLKRGGTISEFSFAIEKAETGGKYGKPAEYWQAFKNGIADGSARQIKKPMGKDKRLEDAWEMSAIEYRVPNPDVADQVNTCQKMSQKRALVAAVLIAVNASEFFTQDIEDIEEINLPASTAAGHAASENNQHGKANDSSAAADYKSVLARLKAIRTENQQLFSTVAASLNIKGMPEIDTITKAKHFLSALDAAKAAADGEDVQESEFVEEHA